MQRFEWEIIYFCVGGLSVLTFWGTDEFSCSRLGGISKQDPKVDTTRKKDTVRVIQNHIKSCWQH